MKENYQIAYESWKGETSAKTASWIAPLQTAALTRFLQLGFPTLKDEEWKYTNVEPIAQTEFDFPFESSIRKVGQNEIDPYAFGQKDWNRLIFVNGIYQQESSLISKPAGVEIKTLREALLSDENLKNYLAKQADFKNNAFIALNTAFLYDGAFVFVPDGKVIPEPIHLMFFSVSEDENIIAQPRNLFILGEGARVKIIESYISFSPAHNFTNTVTEIFLNAGARLEHYKIQRESPSAYHIGAIQAIVNRDSHLSSFSFSLGGQLSRTNLNVCLAEQGAHCELNGLYLAKDHQHVDHHTVIDHAKPNGTSRQNYKGVLMNQSRAVFNGKIFVRQDAQKTDANQINKNLLLSEGASVDTKPQLEIFADDVKCTHGAAVGQLEPETIFYVKSRGFSEESARKLLTHGFASEIVDEVKIEPVRSHLDQLVWQILEK